MDALNIAALQVRQKYLELRANVADCTDWQTLDARQSIPDVAAQVDPGCYAYLLPSTEAAMRETPRTLSRWPQGACL